MGVPCPCQRCTSGMTLGHWSDVVPRPYLVGIRCILGGAYGCILDQFCSVICYLLSVLVIDAVCNTRHSQFLGASYSTHMRTPLNLSDCLRGHPSVWLWRYKVSFNMIMIMIWYLFWARGRWLTYVSAPYLCYHYSVYIQIFLLHHNSVYQFCFVLLCFYICSLGFLSSAAFLFPAAGYQVCLWVSFWV